MAGKRAYNPSFLAGANQLEARVVLSHVAAHHLPVPLVHAGGHHHAAAPHLIKIHEKAAHHASKEGKRTGPTSQSNPTTPIIVLPISTPPEAQAPTSPAATSTGTPTSSTGSTPLPIPIVSGVMSVDEQTIVDLVNQQRQQAGLAPLTVSAQLVQEAQIQSADMAELNDMDHVLPGAALPTLQERAQYVGYNFSYLGENIAFNYPDDNSVMTAWMNSPDHRANILDANYTQIGVGIAYDSQGEPYYTQEFGQPA